MGQAGRKIPLSYAVKALAWVSLIMSDGNATSVNSLQLDLFLAFFGAAALRGTVLGRCEAGKTLCSRGRHLDTGPLPHWSNTSLPCARAGVQDVSFIAYITVNFL